ncbi:MAG: putative holin-like toxin [Defluviitaleaceae bacterium]|nr:putative holin-like toxin [Defluviitaleaceae bacterium]
MYKYLDSGVRSKGEHMSVAEAIGIMFTFGVFILKLLTYIDINRNQKK